LDILFSNLGKKLPEGKFFKGIDAGFWGNLVWKGTMVKNLQAWQQTVRCLQ
jgi:hypothetical protein